MPEYLESGMVFDLDDECLWRPEHITAELKMEHVKACDFVWLDGQSLWFIEAKTSVPPEDQVAALRQKLSHVLLMLTAAAVGRQVSWSATVPKTLRAPDAFHGSVRYAVVVSEWKPEWAAVLQTSLDTALRPVTNAFALDQVAVVGPNEAESLGIPVKPI